jgi:AcrR family transcriptional regulator
MRADKARPRGRPKDEALTAQRREAILDVAGRIFARRGFRNTDVQEVALAAGVGKGTVYRHFPNKRALFLSAVDQGMQRLQACVDEEAPRPGQPLGDLRAGLEATLEAHLGFFDRHPEVVELLIQERAEFKDREQSSFFVHAQRNKARWQGKIEALRAQGRIRDVPSEELHEFMTQLIYGTMFVNYFQGRRRAIGAQVRRIVDVVLLGVLSERERRHDAAAPPPPPRLSPRGAP